jgi:L-alanine-DL-glutamate epimerase-like enolase superfamily enzyme
MPTIYRIVVTPFIIPTAAPQSDGTFEWDKTTLVVVEAESGNVRGLGYTYADTSTAVLIRDLLAAVVRGRMALDVAGAWDAMIKAVRNLGRPGIASMAIAAVDNALWDLKARLLGVPLVSLLGAVRREIPVYGSGGFTSHSIDELQRQLADWVSAGIWRVKMKVGRDPMCDVERVRAARHAIGTAAELFVDANGAYVRKQALAQAERFSADAAVSWFEEPVPSEDLVGLRLLRDRGPSAMAITAGEYGYDLGYFRRMLEAGAVDVLQVDATRCAGVTGFLRGAALCEAFGVPLSAHTAPSLHAHLCCAITCALHVEYFFDHARIETMLFDGVLVPNNGALRPDLSRPGFGIELKRSEAARYAA